jgi:glycosyltransferase involved in cell wall biosynthesis
MRTIHFVTLGFPPQQGGLERWAFDFTSMLGESSYRVIVYVCREQPLSGKYPTGPFEIVDIPDLRAVWEAPLEAFPPDLLAWERTRLDVVCLRHAIKERYSGQSDIVISNFGVRVGHSAMLVSNEMQLPHVIIISGTDFSRGFRNPPERAVLAEVCRTATIVVCKSDEQFRSLRQFARPDGAVVIPKSLRAPEQIWDFPSITDRISLFTDTGLSYKKGTSVLLEAFSELHRAGLPVRLEICGKIEQWEGEYWARRMEEMRAAFGSDFAYMGYVDRDSVFDRLYRSHIYCSATLGEGSSAARSAALCVGIPMMTTRCGELAGPPAAPQIRLVDIADARGFVRSLRQLVEEMAAGKVEVDRGAVMAFRAHFDPARERKAWLALLGGLTGKE